MKSSREIGCKFDGSVEALACAYPSRPWRIYKKMTIWKYIFDKIVPNPVAGYHDEKKFDEAHCAA